MVKRSVRIRVEDILQAIAEADECLDGRDFAAYQKSVVTRRAVERCVEVISEASRHIPDDIQASYSDIPWRSIRDIGNVLRHTYGRVDDLVMWRIAAKSLHELKAAMTSILASLPPETDD